MKYLFVIAFVMVLPCAAQEAKVVAHFQKAVALAVNPSADERYVIEGGAARILRISKDGTVLANIGGFGVEREGFDSPKDITTDGVNVYIADRGNQRISHFDRYLNFIALLQNRPDASSQLSQEPSSSLAAQVWRPISISISPQGDLFLLDEAQQQAIRINPFNFTSLQQQRQNPIQFIFGGFNSGAGRLIQPNRLQATKSGKIFVSDEGAKCLMVYDLFGNFVTSVGVGLLKLPFALASGEVVVREANGEKKLSEWVLVADDNQVFIFNASQAEGFKLIGRLSTMQIQQFLGHSAGRLVDIGLTANEFFFLSEKKLVSVPISALSAKAE